MAAAAAAGCRSLRTQSIRLGSVNPDTMHQLPVVAAEQLGYFSRFGIQIQLDALPSSARAMQALLSRSADVISTTFDQLVLIAGENRGIRSFLLMQRCPMFALVVSPVAGKLVHSITDLKGATIGVTSPGSAIHLQLNYMLTRVGVDPQEVSVVGLGSNAARVSALESGKVTAAILGDPGLTLLERRHPNLLVLADTRTPEGTNRALGSDAYPGAVLIARDQWLSDNRDRARRLATAVVGAIKWIRDTPADEVASHIPREYRIGDNSIYTECVKRLVPALSMDGIMPARMPEQVKKVLSTFDAKVRSANVDTSRTFTNEFVTGL
jgi:NitT/TauT family transport system substrate-binding protein